MSCASQGCREVLKSLIKNVRDLPPVKESGLAAVGHRVVHGGNKYTNPTVIDERVRDGIEALCSLAPLHNPANLAGIEATTAALGEDIPQAGPMGSANSRCSSQVAVFDTAFHHTLPAYASLYAIPYEISQKYGIRRYGFHGISHKYVSR